MSEEQIIYEEIIKLITENKLLSINGTPMTLNEVNNYITNLQQENKQLKEEIQQFQYDFEKQEAEVFNELEQAINELDLSDKTKEYLIDLMNKDVIIVFGIVEDKIQKLKEKYNGQ